MNIFTDELMYQYIITGAFVFVINTFLLCSCMSQLKEELQPEEELQQEEELQPEEELQDQEDEDQEDENQEDEDQEEENQEDQEDEEYNNNLEEIDEDEDNNNLEEDNNNLEVENEEKEETNILKTGEEDSHVYKGFNLMTKKQLIRFVGREHTYKNKNELIIIAINKFILISIDRVDSIPVFVKKYIKNA
jgi:CCR4-NOT transcription complex subunit 1